LNRIVTASASGFRRLNLFTEQPHGFEIGTQVAFIAPADHVLQGTYDVKALDGIYGFSIQLAGPSAGVSITENTTPYITVYEVDADEEITSPPIRIFRDGIELFIGSDYLLNFSTTNTFASEFPRGLELSQALEDARSGKCYIRMTNPSLTSVYWAEYRPLANQWLGKTKLVRLKNGRVVFSNKFRRCKGIINTIAILRSDFTNPYITPLLRNYSLKLRSFS